MCNAKLNLNGVWKLVCFLLLCGAAAACSEKEDEGYRMEISTGIPNDDKADPNPEIEDPTASIPNIQYSVEEETGYIVIRVDMTGVQDPETLEWLRLVGTGGADGIVQNVWVSVDGRPKGITVYNTIDDTIGRKVPNDVVFLVDNSGSMSEEADAVARDIVAWAQLLNTTLDVRFGCAGYDGAINGARNMTSYEEMSAFLNRSTGTRRTKGFEGEDAGALSSAAEAYRTGGGSSYECGAAALRFADEHFAFRKDANRIYVNFTDEPNQPAGKPEFSVEYVADQSTWDTTKGTIHTVFSGSTSFSERANYQEYPWRMSEYTGGTTLYASSQFTGISLEDLPVTGAMRNSYIIRFTNIDELLDGQPHEVKITVRSADGKVRAEKTFTVTFGTKA